MPILTTTFVKSIFEKHKETSLFGKWIRFQNIEPLFKKHESIFEIQQLGASELHKPIMQLKIGTGEKRILLWSQMHGNESTGTRALFDLFNCFSGNSKKLSTILENCTLLFIPMLNPDGAEVYTRVNANNIDLNRDAVDRVAIESKLLRKTLEDFNPHFCFNLHDQRTIFGVEGTKNTATISFLAPSEEVSRAITKGRIQTMNVIVAMNELLQQIIPNFIGRYTDEFYPTATGDNFQKLGYNTILIESGHFPEDYSREFSREFTFYAILQGLFHIATNTEFNSYQSYFEIPNNKQMFFDVIQRNPTKKDLAYQYVDKIIDNQLVSYLEKIEGEDLKNKTGLNEIVFFNKNI
ncbi:M14 family zinc carboxypeptidase [Polaribacter gangjinensis]|uniref:Zinc carboxypeptidase n=1 Tax=Polaribacter gangjinensis TaxID=574710 RepID=A0A2S7WB00_9FLAO|nr:M14 family zinc carboxypeptidase [Polaribacter gangjinensis]PQJ74412.1 zinc carboxypeptidase [Polaribacter gangjinensis]